MSKFFQVQLYDHTAAFIKKSDVMAVEYVSSGYSTIHMRNTSDLVFQVAQGVEEIMELIERKKPPAPTPEPSNWMAR